MYTNGGTVIIGGKKYRFCNRLNDAPTALESFNQLAKETFDIQFNRVGGEYEPHVLMDGDIVCANISVNQIHFLDHGKRKFYIQLGTVMTKVSYRGQGLCRWLMEEVVKEWKDKCYALYLFANDSVLEFYPKFDFEVQEEYEFVYENTSEDPAGTGCFYKKLSMENPEAVSLVYEKYHEGNPFSDFYMMENKAILEFYINGIFKDHIYYIEDYGVVVFLNEQPGEVYFYEIFGKTDSTLEHVLKTIKNAENNRVILGFTPKDKAIFTCERHREEDTTLFIYRHGENRFKLEKGMFPELSHA